MSKRVIILGASGFIGSWLLNRAMSNPEYAAQGYSSKDCDLLSFDSIENALLPVTLSDVVIMAAAVTRLRENDYASMMKNTLMAENVARFVEKHPPSQVIFLSTVDVYGLVKAGTLISEKLLPDPFDYYATGKLASEFILKRSCIQNRVPLLVLRLSGVYGPGGESTSTINRLLESVLQHGKVTIWGDGEDKRDFVYVDDVYNIIEQAITTKTNGVINVATGNSYSINHIVEIIRDCYGKDFSVEHRPREKGGEERVGEMIYDITLLTRAFPDFKFVDLPEGISRCLSRYQMQGAYHG